jgi:hypothetical protein
MDSDCFIVMASPVSVFMYFAGIHVGYLTIVRLIICASTFYPGHSLALRLVEALRCKPEGRGFGITGILKWSFRPHCGPGADSAPEQK